MCQIEIWLNQLNFFAILRTSLITIKWMISLRKSFERFMNYLSFQTVRSCKWYHEWFIFRGSEVGKGKTFVFSWTWTSPCCTNHCNSWKSLVAASFIQQNALNIYFIWSDDISSEVYCKLSYHKTFCKLNFQFILPDSYRLLPIFHIYIDHCAYISLHPC